MKKTSLLYINVRLWISIHLVWYLTGISDININFDSMVGLTKYKYYEEVKVVYMMYKWKRVPRIIDLNLNVVAIDSSSWIWMV